MVASSVQGRGGVVALHFKVVRCSVVNEESLVFLALHLEALSYTPRLPALPSSPSSFPSLLFLSFLSLAIPPTSPVPPSCNVRCDGEFPGSFPRRESVVTRVHWQAAIELNAVHGGVIIAILRLHLRKQITFSQISPSFTSKLSK
ncbi:hypothetical protein E2C01_061135 [Portunus trituberculatus]|uniref:Uncharacterized protein n=1 Tax=Portunus trituberculatus TaxID=210409 RepID=A0A5B7HAI9_PORTR|nr:hypothetical protein [Portunus trituberculatus]